MEKKEPQKTIVELKEEDRNLLKSFIDYAKEQKIKVEAPSATEKPSEESHVAHESIEDLLNCPDCYPQVKKEVLQKVAKETEGSDLFCEGCGLRVKEDWESCPSCGGKEAKRK